MFLALTKGFNFFDCVVFSGEWRAATCTTVSLNISGNSSGVHKDFSSSQFIVFRCSLISLKFDFLRFKLLKEWLGSLTYIFVCGFKRLCVVRILTIL